VDWSTLGERQAGDLIRELATRHTCAILACEPTLLPWVPLLAGHLPVVLGLHYRGDRNRFGFGMIGGRRIPQVLQTLLATGRVALTSDCSVQAVDNARLLGLADDAVQVAPNGIVVPDWDGAVSVGPVRSVTLLCRLAGDKLLHVRAAIELVAAGLARGRDVTLQIYGSGRAEWLVRRMLQRALPASAWRLDPANPDITSILSEADVVVGTSRASLDALALGRRVVAAKTVRDPRGQLGPLATPSTFDALAAENFGWRRPPPVPADHLWDKLESVTAAELTAVADRARREHSADAMLQRELEIAEALDVRPDGLDQVLATTHERLRQRWGGARRLPRPLDLPDRGIFALRRDEGFRW
jgi:hypothetical protein